MVLLGKWREVFSVHVSLVGADGAKLPVTSEHDLLELSLHASTEALRTLDHAHVFVGLPIPTVTYQGFDPLRPALESANQNGAAIRTGSMSDYQKDNGDVREIITRAQALGGFTLLDPAPLFCDNQGCIVGKDGKNIYFDDSGHITRAGAEFAAGLFAPVFGN